MRFFLAREAAHFGGVAFANPVREVIIIIRQFYNSCLERRGEDLLHEALLAFDFRKARIFSKRGDEIGDLAAEMLGNLVEIGARVFDGVVEDGGGERRFVGDPESQRQRCEYPQRMHDVRNPTAFAEMALMAQERKFNRIRDNLQCRPRHGHECIIHGFTRSEKLHS